MRLQCPFLIWINCQQGARLQCITSYIRYLSCEVLFSAIPFSSDSYRIAYFLLGHVALNKMLDAITNILD